MITRFTIHWHRPAFLNPLSAVAQPTAAAPDRQPDAHLNGSLNTVQRINLGFVKLKVHRPNTAEIALRAQMQRVRDKGVPRPSKNALPEGQVDACLNCKVDVAPTIHSSREDRSPVVCGHFALEFAQESRKKSALTSTFTELGIRVRFEGTLAERDDALDNVINNAGQGSKHVVQSDDLGGYLAAMATALKNAPEGQDRPKDANSLLLTTNHAMALHVERKSKVGVEYFSAKLYDPNSTANYKRVETLTPEALGSLEMKDLLIQPELISDYGGGRKCAAVDGGSVFGSSLAAAHGQKCHAPLSRKPASSHAVWCE